MSIPIHNLYDYIHTALENRFLLSYFYPYGKKQLENCICLQSSLIERMPEIDHNFLINSEHNLAYKIFPKNSVDIGLTFRYNTRIICNDQEPLDYEYYQNKSNHKSIIEKKSKIRSPYEVDNISNLRWVKPSNFMKKWILLHSEINGKNLNLYQKSSNFECAYWWSHAMISRDWYRFAEHDKFLQPSSEIKKIFLMYCRDTSGSRNYRNYFLNKLSNIQDQIQTKSFNDNADDPSLSAEYNFYDYNNTGISVILETVFDDRIHLTEKTLRCLAVGHPFILAAGAGSLQYLKTYGFRTFAPMIDESYDLEQNIDKRKKSIINEIQRIATLDDKNLKNLINECKKIANHNKKVFFSKDFTLQIEKELKNNIKNAQKRCNNEFDVNLMWEHRKYHEINNPIYLKHDPVDAYRLLFLKHLKKGGTIENYVPPDLD